MGIFYSFWSLTSDRASQVCRRSRPRQFPHTIRQVHEHSLADRLCYLLHCIVSFKSMRDVDKHDERTLAISDFTVASLIRRTAGHGRYSACLARPKFLEAAMHRSFNPVVCSIHQIPSSTLRHLALTASSSGLNTALICSYLQDVPKATPTTVPYHLRLSHNLAASAPVAILLRNFHLTSLNPARFILSTDSTKMAILTTGGDACVRRV